MNQGKRINVNEVRLSDTNKTDETLDATQSLISFKFWYNYFHDFSFMWNACVDPEGKQRVRTPAHEQ